jgi:hypothetical protein
MVKHPFSILQRYTCQKSRAHSSQAKKIGRGDLATRPINVQDLWPGFQSDMLNFFHFTRKILHVKLIEIKLDLLINYQGYKLGDRALAWEPLAMINPVNQARSPEEIAIYKVEPYVVTADV